MSILKYIRELKKNDKLSRMLKHMRTRGLDFYICSVDDMKEKVPDLTNNQLRLFVSKYPYFNMLEDNQIQLVLKIKVESIEDIKNTYEDCTNTKQFVFTFLHKERQDYSFDKFDNKTRLQQLIAGIHISPHHFAVTRTVVKHYLNYI